MFKVEWLVENFEPGEGCSLRRSSLYSYYLQHCSQQKLESVNPASFGKLIRSVFLGLKTRRLGTRGNSKYHYYGIRIKLNSPLNNSSDEQINNHFYQFKNSKSQFSNDEDSSPENDNNSSIYQSDLSQTDTKTFVQQNNSFIINQTIFIDPSIQINIQQLIQLFENSYKDHCQVRFLFVNILSEVLIDDYISELRNDYRSSIMRFDQEPV
jgi:regulatory factor X 1/2/3